MQWQWIHNAETDLNELRRASKSTVVLPLGSIESHGPHLPLGCDTLHTGHLVDRILAIEPTAMLPLLTYSYVAEATRLPGAIHIPSDLLMQLVETIGDEVHRNGFEKLVLLHGHGGNVALHAMFCKRMLEREKNYAVYSIPPLPGMGEFIRNRMTSEHFGHACEFETSLLMVAAPGLVHLERVAGRRYEPQPAPRLPDVATPVDWISQWPEMAVGEPALANAEKGEQILAEWARRVADLLARIKQDRIVPDAMAAQTAGRHR